MKKIYVVKTDFLLQRQRFLIVNISKSIKYGKRTFELSVLEYFEIIEIFVLCTTATKSIKVLSYCFLTYEHVNNKCNSIFFSFFKWSRK